MTKGRIHFPDPDAVARALERSGGTAAEVILRLAWDLGLLRDEICRLTWSGVSFGEKTLLLPDRAVPMEREACQCLLKRWEQRRDESDYVVTSDRLHRPMRPESVSRVARAALDAEPLLAGVRLTDLRHGFILRQARRHGWPYAARVSGIAVSTMQSLILPAMREAGLETAAQVSPAPPAGRERLQALIQKEEGSPAALAMQMALEGGVALGEGIALTWDQVDFAGGSIRLPGRRVPMGAGLRRRLLALRDSRGAGADPHVLLTPKTARPYRSSEITRAVRAALVRGGMDVPLQELLRRLAAEDAGALVVRRAEERGSVSCREAAELSGGGTRQAGALLRRLTEEKKLVRVGAKYYPPGTVVAPEDQYDAIYRYLQKTGTAFRKELADLLKIEARPCGWILHNLVEQGKLIKTGQRYELPPEEEQAE